MFLDITADRYFCLSAAAEESFARLLDGTSLAAEDGAVLDALARHGPLTKGTGKPLMPCSATRPARVHPPDIWTIRPTSAQLMLAAGSLALAPLRLRAFGLAGVICRLQMQKRRVTVSHYAESRMAGVAAAFARLRYIVTAHDRCLTRSIALASRLSAEGVTAELVIGVQLRPFTAHAWVQSQDRLLNDRIDVVRDFTPILVV